MKRKSLYFILIGTMAASSLLGGCSMGEQKGLETDDLTISQYKDLEVDASKEGDEITNEEVESQITSTLKNYAESAADGYEVRDGDTVSIEYVGKIDGETFDGGSTTGPTDLVIGSNTYIDGFEDSCIGHKKGDTFDWNGAFPEDYGNTDYAGKDVTFTITIDDIKVDPELTDELVQEISDTSKTVKEYKKEVKKNLEDAAKESAEENFESSVWQLVMDNTTVNNYPEDEVDELCDSAIEQYKSYAEAYDMTYEDLVQNYQNQTVEEFESDLEESAKNVVKQQMVVDAIAEKEKIEPTKKEYKKMYKKIASTYGYEDVDALKEAVSEDDLKDLALSYIVRDWVSDRAVESSSK